MCVRAKSSHTAVEQGLMKYTVHTNLREGILEARLVGERSPFEIEIADDAIDAWEYILEQCRLWKTYRVLATFALTSRTTTVVSVLVAHRLESIGFDRTLQVALVDNNADSRALNEFGCKVAAGRGWQFRAFPDTASALGWLRAEGAPAP
jgi:hypothetical protein